MDISTKQRLLTICAELEAKNLPISVGLLKARAKQPIPLPKIISVINAFKGGERAETLEALLVEDTVHPSKDELTPLSNEELTQQLATQQTAIEVLQEQVLRLTQTIEKMRQ